MGPRDVVLAWLDAFNRTDADALCAKLRAAGGACTVFQQRAKAVGTNGVATLASSSHAPKSVTPAAKGIVVHGRPLRRGE